VTVSGVDDFAVDGDSAYTVVLAAATSTDGNYNGLDPADVAVTNTDNDVLADLSLTKNVDISNPNVGDAVIFTITVSNAGPAAATGVEVSDLLTGGYTYINSFLSQGTYDNGTGLWVLGTINSGASAILTIEAAVNAAGPYGNSAEVTAADQMDPDSSPNDGAGDDYATLTVTPQNADLAVNKIVNDATPNVGDTVTFTISVANAGPDAATGVEVIDLLEGGYTYVSSSPSQGAYDNVSGIWTVGTINSGANALLTIDATVDAAGPYGNTAGVSDADQQDPDGSDDSATVSVTPKQADLEISKTVSPTNPAIGANASFTIMVSNAGPDAATGVEVTDLLAGGYTYVSGTASQGAYDSATGIWAVGTLNNGAGATLTIDATVHAMGPYDNTATITSADQQDPDGTDDSSSVAVVVNNPPSAVDDNAMTPVDAAVTFNVIANDSDSDGSLDPAGVDLDPSTAGIQTSFTVTGQGSFASDGGGNVTFTPVAGFSGVAVSSYTIRDDLGAESNSAALTVTVENYAATSVVAEVNSTAVEVNQTAHGFNFDILPTINGGDTGIDRVTITPPAGFANINIANVVVGGTPLTANCPAPGAGEYCVTVAGQQINFDLGTRVTSSLTNIHVDFTADTPSSSGSYLFEAAVEDTATAAAGPVAAVEGDADFDPADFNSLAVIVTLAVSAQQSGVSVDPAVVVADGTAVSTITVRLVDSQGNPKAGKDISLATSRGAVDTLGAATGTTDANGRFATTIQSLVTGETVITATDTTDGIVLAQQPSVFFSQGRVLDLVLTANKEEVQVGDIVTYLAVLKNRTLNDITPARLRNTVPVGFKYLEGSARINGADLADPAAGRTLFFDLGTVPALVDGNGNGAADPGEPGYVEVVFQLVVASGASPGDYEDRALAVDVCNSCGISNADEAEVTVAFDPIFDLGTVIGKVFHDENRDGRQDEDENGVAGVMVALDDGTYVLTDEYGRYHFPAVKPGHRLLKINLRSLADGAEATTRETVVVDVTPGLLARANFGVLYRPETIKTGKPPEPGLAVETESVQQPIQVLGNAENLTVLINGEMAAIPSDNIRLLVENLDEVVELTGQPGEPVAFQIDTEFPNKVRGWQLKIMNPKGGIVHRIAGQGRPPKVIHWNGRIDRDRKIAGGDIYQYQLEVRYADGSRATSAKKLFGINQSTAISINLAGTAFMSGSSILSPQAEAVLADAAKVLRKYPDEKIIIEGHTDSVGDELSNLELSKNRAMAALNYLAQKEGIPEDRFVVRWFGESQPITSNDSPETRALNRRIEIKGDLDKVERSKVFDQYRTEPAARIDGKTQKLDGHGRFAAEFEPSRVKHFTVEVTNSRGQSFNTTFNVPDIEILQDEEGITLPFGAEAEGYAVREAELAADAEVSTVLLTYDVHGKTEPGNTVEIDGTPLVVEADGSFTATLELRRGNNPFGVLVRNSEGTSRIVNLIVTVNDRDREGKLILATEPIPNLAVQLPPRGVPLTDPLVPITGATDPGNRVEINGEPVPVEADGTFSVMHRLPVGDSVLVIRAIDPMYRVGEIVRNVQVKDSHLFFLAFADGKVGLLKTEGYLEGAGAEDSTEFFTDGRVAFYLKGVVKGRYLITAALDTGRGEFDELFKDLDEAETDRLLTSLDPDKNYPVYGDSSTLVYDTESQGKLYLAVDSETFNAVLGNYQLNLDDTELARYQSTFFGTKVAYKSLSQTKYGQPHTKVVIFGAEVRQTHVTDQMRATGGSLYFLSHRDVIEGSEQVTLVVRDKNTGLTLSRSSQQQNIDYTIKYDEGRILFNRPIASTTEDEDIINEQLLHGHPVIIEAVYEAKEDAFDKTAGGGRARQQIGDHLALGGTYVKDDVNGESYELQSMDAEVRLSRNTRIIGEYARSAGIDSQVFVSDDGGLSFVASSPNGTREGDAWKLAAEIDLGEWFQDPDRYRLGAYYKRLEPGFSSSGNSSESGSDQSGLNLNLKLTDRDTLRAKFQQVETAAGTATAASEETLGTVQWAHQHGWWGLTLEYQGRDFKQDGGDSEKRSTAAADLEVRPTDDLTVNLQHQQTLSGTDNNQSTLGVQYQVHPKVALTASGTTGTDGNAARGGAVLDLDGKKIYVNQELADSRPGKKSTTVVGSEAALGKSTKIYNEYQWQQTDDTNRNVSLLGLQQQWEAAPGLKLLLSGEYSAVDSPDQATDRYALAGGFTYSHSIGLKATSRQEYRIDDAVERTVQFLTTNNLELKISPDFTLLGKLRYSDTRNKTTDETVASFQEMSLGLAFRPVHYDRLNALAKITRLADEGPRRPGEMVIGESESTVASVEWAFDITRSLEWVEKTAYKINSEKVGDLPMQDSHTLLSISRLNWNFWRDFDLGLEYRMLLHEEAEDLRQGWLTELMWRPVEHFRVGVGYNFTDFSDDEFSENDFSTHGWFLRFQAIY